LDRKLVERIDKMLAEDVPKLMSMIPHEEQTYMEQKLQSGGGVTSKVNTVFSDQDETPFGIGSIDGINAGVGEYDWIVTRSRHEYDQVFSQLSPQNGKISGASARQEMIKSKLVGLNQ
jgi:EH domain-containing protein 1